MRAPLKDLMDSLGVGYVLSAYETCPWSAYDEGEDEVGESESNGGLSCNAEVRMNSDGDEFEAELQILHDEPKPGEVPIEQICWILGKPAVGDKWDIKVARVKSEDKKDTVHGWETKSVAFFQACVQELKLGKIPDIDEIYQREIEKKERFGGNSQGGGSKSPKIKPAALLNPKGGMGR